MKNSLCIICLIVLVGCALSGCAPAPVDARPGADTVACRDLQIDRMRTVQVTVDRADPDRSVRKVLELAAELRALCQ